MKKSLSLIVISLLPALVGLSAWANEKEPGKAPGKSETPRIVPFYGKLAAYDASASTITVGKRVFRVTPETKVLKDNQPASLTKDMVGERVGGAYVKESDGTLRATTVRLGDKEKEGDKDPGDSKPSTPGIEPSA